MEKLLGRETEGQCCREPLKNGVFMAHLMAFFFGLLCARVRSIIDSQKTNQMVTNPKAPFVEIKFHVNDY